MLLIGLDGCIIFFFFSFVYSKFYHSFYVTIQYIVFNTASSADHQISLRVGGNAGNEPRTVTFDFLQISVNVLLYDY
jgi:hypothetical protein